MKTVCKYGHPLDPSRQAYKHRCLVCRREGVFRAKVRGRRLRRAMIDALKADPCVDCEQCFPPECMDFDHRESDKIAGIANMVCAANSARKILAEVAKCDLVCANCHRVRTRYRQLQRSK